MKSQKSDNEGNLSKVSASQPLKAKLVARTKKPKDGNQMNAISLAKQAGDKNGAETIQSLSEHPVFPVEEELQARVARRAYELYEQRGWQHGYDLADWCQAANEILTPKSLG
jgi:hypothetical protein